MRYYLLVLFAVLAAGCVVPEIAPGSPEEYELPGINNTTIYYLNLSSAQVVKSVDNATSVELLIGESGEANFRNPVAVDDSGKRVMFNASKPTSIFGLTYIVLEFSPPFSGFVAYTQVSEAQDFSRPLTENGSVRVILPSNFTTGSRLLGTANPKPDNVTIDSRGREVLIWDSPYPEHDKIEVKYYIRGAPNALLYVLISLFIFAAVVYAYYYFSVASLRRRRELIEKGEKNKK